MCHLGSTMSDHVAPIYQSLVMRQEGPCSSTLVQQEGPCRNTLVRQEHPCHNILVWQEGNIFVRQGVSYGAICASQSKRAR